MTTTNRTRSVLLWTAQSLLAALFLFAGGMKLVTPAAELAKMGPLPVDFLRFIGVCETLGALGLVLPGIFRVRRELTALAAAGLVVIMTGAVIVSIPFGATAMLIPAVVGTFCAWIARNRGEETIGRLPRISMNAGRRAHA